MSKEEMICLVIEQMVYTQNKWYIHRANAILNKRHSISGIDRKNGQQNKWHWNKWA